MINVVEMYSNETSMWSLREKSLRRSLGELQVGQKKYYLLSLFSLGGGGALLLYRKSSWFLIPFLCAQKN